MSRGKKRQRTEENEEEEKETQHFALPDGLRALMGGRKFCPQEELTREVLFQYLKAKGDIREVDGLLDVTVQTMTGKSFDVVLESGSTAQIGLLKSEIKEAEGTPACRQDLFVLRAGEAAVAEEGSAVPLADDFVISESCTIALCVAIAPEWAWDATSDSVGYPSFFLSGQVTASPTREITLVTA